MDVNISRRVEQVEQVERLRASKVAKFLELARDPDIQPYLSILLNGKEPEGTKGPFVAPAGFKSGNFIREAICDLPLPDTFTVDSIFDMLTSTGFVFESQDHRGTVRDALSALSKGEAPKFRIVRKGAGGKPNIYERIDR